MLNVIKGRIKKPLLMLLYGVDKVGKTTFASQAPGVIFLGPEAGNNNMDVARLPTPKSYQDLLDQCQQLLIEKHDYKTAAFDSLDWIEGLVHAQLCAKYNVAVIEEAAGGYGKWVAVVVSEWKKLIDLTAQLRDKGMNIIFIAHYQVKAFNDPMTSVPYDRYMVKLVERVSATFREYVDIMGFATFEVSVKANKGASKGKGYGDGIRVLYTERRPSHDAGNRFSLPYELPLDFQSIMNAVDASTISDPQILVNDIKNLCADMTDQELLKKINESIVGADVNKLIIIKNRILTIKGGN
jgi:hypothetical protein